MFSNLEAEQARYHMTNKMVAELLGISRVSYENKKKSGKFVVAEVIKLCSMFNVGFDYLFATDNDKKTA